MNEQSANLTMNVGTAAYCAPEILKSQVSSMPHSINPSTSTSTSLNSLSEPLLQEEHGSQQQQLPYDAKCDVYSFAVIMYAVYFQNKSPYGNMTDSQILFHLLQNHQFRPKYNESVVPQEDRWFFELMKQCWHSDPNQRPTFEYIGKIFQKH